MIETTPKHICFVIADLGSGGAQKIASGLMGHFVDQGHKVSCITLDDAAEDFFAIPSKVRRITLNNRSKSGSFCKALLSNMRRILSIRSALKKQKPDTVISFIAPTNILTILAVKGLRAKLIISERNDPSRQSFGRAWDLLRRILYKQADIVTANSMQAIETMNAYVPKQSLMFIPNQLCVPKRTYKRPIEEKENIILAVGRLHPQKRFDLLIEAFTDLHPQHPNWKLVIAGHGALEYELKNQCKNNGISEYIEFLGQVQNPYKQYAHAKIFTLPSSYEGTPNALLEALSCGVLTVVSDSIKGAAPFIKDQENGFTFLSGDHKDLQRALEKAINICDQRPDLYEQFSTRSIGAVKELESSNIYKIWESLI